MQSKYRSVLMNVLTIQVKEEMKRDVKEITRIAIEGGIAANEIDNLYSYIHHNQTLSLSSNAWIIKL